MSSQRPEMDSNNQNKKKGHIPMCCTRKNAAFVAYWSRGQEREEITSNRCFPS